MEGAPQFKEQPRGPFAKRKWFNQIVVFCRAMALMKVKGGKIVYGDNGPIIEIGGAGNIVTFDVWRNGVLTTQEVLTP
jgi:hypothetical protein